MNQATTILTCSGFLVASQSLGRSCVTGALWLLPSKFLDRFAHCLMAYESDSMARIEAIVLGMTFYFYKGSGHERKNYERDGS